MPQPHLRAADADRAAVAEVLGRHMSAGRLTLDEFDERLTRAYAAKTFGELAELTVDLPPVDGARTPGSQSSPVQAPVPPPMGAAASTGRVPTGHVPWGHTPGTPAAWGHGSWGNGDDLRSAWRAWLTTALIVLTVWAATSLASWEFHYFWPVWVIGPWGAVLLARTLTGGREQGPEQRRLPGG
jgi:Domain of unknown function (DUF1707)